MHNIGYIGSATTYEEAIERLDNYHGPVVIDTETIGLRGDKAVMLDDWDDEGEVTSIKTLLDARTCIGIGIAISPTEAWYFPVGQQGMANVPECDLSPLLRKLDNERVTKIFYNSMFDLDVIENGVGIEVNNFDDVAIAAQVQGLWNSLDQNLGQLLGIDHETIPDVLPKGKTMLDLSFGTVAVKCMYDCMDTFKLYYLFKMDKWHEKKNLTWTDHVGRTFDVTTRIIDCYLVDRYVVPIY